MLRVVYSTAGHDDLGCSQLRIHPERRGAVSHHRPSVRPLYIAYVTSPLHHPLPCPAPLRPHSGTQGPSATDAKVTLTAADGWSSDTNACLAVDNDASTKSTVFTVVWSGFGLESAFPDAGDKLSYSLQVLSGVGSLSD